jgi:hypothetical protein
MLTFLFSSTIDNACGLPNPATLVFTHPPLFHIDQCAWLHVEEEVYQASESGHYELRHPITSVFDMDEATVET